MSDVATDRAMLVMLAAAALKSDRVHVEAQRYGSAGEYAANVAIGALRTIDSYLVNLHRGEQPT